MFYEEKLINGVLMFRTTPTGKWRLCSIKEISKRVVQLDAYKNYIQNNLERIEKGGWTPISYNEFIESEECKTYVGS